MGIGAVNAMVPLYNGLASHAGRVEMFQVTSCYRNRDKLQPDGPLGSMQILLLLNLDANIFVLVEQAAFDT